jgi:hypothetical protein
MLGANVARTQEVALKRMPYLPIPSNAYRADSQQVPGEKKLYHDDFDFSEPPGFGERLPLDLH